MLNIDKKLIIKNGHVIDPGQSIDEVYNIFVADGKITEITKEESLPGFEDAKIIDAKGLHVFPGLIDLHVHFREPGFEYKETIETGARAAEAGGFTTVCVMPNTKPAIDTAERVRQQLELAKAVTKIHVLPVATITLGQNGTELTDAKSLKEAGACALSEDGKSVMNEELMEKAMAKAAEFGLPIFDHCEDMPKVKGGVMNEGKRSHELGLPGISNIVEEYIEERDIRIAERTGATLHLCHCSTKDGARIIEEGKKRGVKLSAETCPHYYALSENDIPGDFGNFKMNPPLRSEEDRIAVKAAVTKGIMDVISTDHAPHGKEEKEQSFLKAPFGIVGLETSFAASYTELVKNGALSLLELARRMSLKPAEILGRNAGTFKKGFAADIMIVDLSKEYVVNPENFKSKGRNTPFTGRKLWGEIKYTIAEGETVYDSESH